MSGLSVRLAAQLPGFELDVAWSAPPGITVVFGYSGAGKSLTLSMITGTMRPDIGRVALGTRVLCDTAAGVFIPPQNRRIGYVAQGAQLFPHMTVQANVEYALHRLPRRERRREALALLGELHVSELAGARPAMISGGQRQRVALARALATQPELLVLDEPFSALDLPLRVEMGEVVRRVQEERGVPVVMVTHDLFEAVSLADTLVVYSGTGAIQCGPPEQLLASPATPEIRRLLHAVELPPGLLHMRGNVRRLPFRADDSLTA